MTLSLREIQNACQMLNIDDHGFYLEIEDKTVYIAWTASREDAEMYIENSFECVDIRIYGHWVDIYHQQVIGTTVVLPDDTIFDCRYILTAK